MIWTTAVPLASHLLLYLDNLLHIEGEAEHEKITIKGYVCAANIHRQKETACTGKQWHIDASTLHHFHLRYRSIDEGLLYKVGDTETLEDQSYTVLGESKGGVG